MNARRAIFFKPEYVTIMHNRRIVTQGAGLSLLAQIRPIPPVKDSPTPGLLRPSDEITDSN